MPMFAWTESYSVRVRQMDAQHQKLFQIINNLAEAMRVGKSQTVLSQVVRDLALYTQTHFTQEESLMKQTGYPALPAHQGQHNQFLVQVEKYKIDLEQDRQPNSVAMLEFLQKWLVEHIQKTDKSYSNHMNTRGVQ